jgi:phosphopantothenoylcysteine synthetase/decarboxylase
MKLRELIWIVLLIGVTLYFTLGKEKQTDFGFDEKAYQRKIDSLISISSNNDKIIDSLKNDNKIRQEKIVGLKGDLTNLNKKAKFYEKQYNEEVSLINDMSDDDIVLEFAKSFK